MEKSSCMVFMSYENANPYGKKWCWIMTSRMEY